MSDRVGPTLHIGILTHGALHHTKRCIASIQHHTGAPWRALVIDNASTDDTPAWLRALDDARISVELRTDNLGVGGGRNRLLACLLPTMAPDDLLIFLDNDIEVADGWEAPFLDAFARSPRLGVAGRWAYSMQVHADWRDILPERTSDSGPADTVQGCCFWVRGTAAHALGSFDEALGRFWHEDDDYCIRALHAGWDVQRVWCPAIQHHEHGSGVALRPDRVAGSLANQAYLARKWHSFGAIDEHGVPRRPEPEPARTLHEQLGTRLGRTTPLLRTEFNSAVEDAARLLRDDVDDATAAQLATPVVRELLSDSAHRGDDEGATRARQVIERIARTLSTRRASSGADVPSARLTRSFNAICNPASWDDPKWHESYRTHFRDGSGADYYGRREQRWRDGQLMHALRVTGGLRREARALLIGDASERLVAAMTHAVSHVTVLDQPETTPEQCAAKAGRPMGSATLECAVWPPAALPQADEDRFDIVVCPNLSRYAPPAQVERALQVLARFARTGATVAVAATVRVAGPVDGRWLEPSFFADDAILSRASLRRIGAFDAAIADETLLAAVDAGNAPAFGPQLSRQIGAHLVTAATCLARRVA